MRFGVRAPILALFLGPVSLALPSHAITQTFTSLSAFQTALGSLPSTSLDFEGLATGSLIPSGNAVDDVTFTYSIASETLEVTDAFDTTSGDNSLGLTGGDNALQDGDVIALGFASPVRALGISFITSDAALADEILLITPEGTAGNSATAASTLGDGGLVYFIGLLADSPFTTSTIDFDDDGQVNFVYNVDDLTTAVPEPSTFFYLGVALAWLGFRGVSLKTEER